MAISPHYDRRSVSKHRREQNLPDPFSNMSFSGTSISAAIVLPAINNEDGNVDGSDILELGELQTISYSMHRENSPVRTIGHVNPRGFVKGSRTIAGSLVFTVFNEYAFYRIKEFREMMSKSGLFFAPLADMLPPFDVVLSFFNEYGLAAKMKIYGITIVDEGQTMSVDDLITEQTYTYMARGIQPMMSVENDPLLLPSDQRAAHEERQQNFFGEPNLRSYTRLIERIIPPGG